MYSFCCATDRRTLLWLRTNSGANWIKHISLCIGKRHCYFVPHCLQPIMTTKLMSSVSLPPQFGFKCFSSGSIIYHHHSVYLIYNMWSILDPSTFLNVYNSYMYNTLPITHNDPSQPDRQPIVRNRQTYKRWKCPSTYLLVCGRCCCSTIEQTTHSQSQQQYSNF